MSETNISALSQAPFKISAAQAEALNTASGGRARKTAKPEVAQPESAIPEQAEVSHDIAYEEAKAMTEEINDIMSGMHNGIRFRVHDDSGELVAQIINCETNEVIRQMPSEDLFNVREKFSEALGIIFDEER